MVKLVTGTWRWIGHMIAWINQNLSVLSLYLKSSETRVTLLCIICAPLHIFSRKNPGFSKQQTCNLSTTNERINLTAIDNSCLQFSAFFYLQVTCSYMFLHLVLCVKVFLVVNLV